MTYVKPSRGLDPSVYGGGGSPSSRSLLENPSFVSRGRAALAWAAAARDEDGGSNGGAGVATDAGPFGACRTASVVSPSTKALFAFSPGVRKSEENEGGSGESAVAVVDVEASKLGAASDSRVLSSHGSATALWR